MEASFLLNGETVRIEGEPPTRTLLDWLRERRGLTGTKEGCNEGDCGACTVMVTDSHGARAVNACILFLPQLEGKAVRTVEGISGPDGALHPVQQSMIDLHGSQCGFCTPGFIVSMATAHANGATDYDDQLAGNLCRCTGYAPIIRAAEAAADAPVPTWIAADRAVFLADALSEGDAPEQIVEAIGPPSASVAPQTADELAAWYLDHPDATLIAGATDVGLWVTKQLRSLDPVCFLGGISQLKGVTIGAEAIHVGAMTSLTDLRVALQDRHPSFAEMIRRYGSTQVRNAATVGGNIANGSPIGDSPPALIALGATLHLRQGDRRRSLPLEDFFVAYGKQDREPGEFVEAVSIPLQPDSLRCYKISKRFDQDISALCGCFNIVVEDGVVTSARIAFGGMAGTPARATHVEEALTGQPWTDATISTATALFAKDYAPMSDMRASADYRLHTAENLLRRCYLDSLGDRPTSVLEVTP